MKTLLLNLPFNLYNASDNNNLLPPLGLAIISGFLKKHELDVTLYDAAAHYLNREQIIKYVLEIKPGILGVTLVTQQMPQAIPFLSEVKEALPETIVVVGGAHPSAQYHEVIEKHQEIDIAVFGEGEYAMKEIIENLQEGTPLKHIRGIAYREEGMVQVNPKRDLIRDLDSLPFTDWDSLPMDRYWYNYTIKKNYTAILLSRGCPFSCTFCAKSVTGKTYRKRSPDHVIEELKLLYDRYHVRDLLIADSLLNMDNEWLKKVCEGILEMNRTITWGCQIRADRVDRETLKLMKKAGCWKIFIGVESADNGMLERMKKGESIEAIEEGIRVIQEEKFQLDLGFIIGMPGETEETIQRTIQFAKRYKNCVSALNLASPFPGTELYEIAKKEGYMNEDWAQFNQNDGLGYIPEGFSRETLLENYKWAVKSVYLNFAFLLNQIRQVRSWLNFKIRFSIACRIFLRRLVKT